MVSRQDSAGSVVMFFHDGLSQQIAVETNAAGTVTSRYLVDAFGVPRGKLDIGNSTGRTYYMTDPRGNVTQMIGYLDQAVKAVFAYDPYGKDKPALSKKIASSNWDSRLKFQMAPRDPKTGSYSLGARLMNPTINRFVGADNYVAAGANLGLQVDPLTGNRYLYAGANPAGLIDDGHGPCAAESAIANSDCPGEHVSRIAMDHSYAGAYPKPVKVVIVPCFVDDSLGGLMADEETLPIKVGCNIHGRQGVRTSAGFMVTVQSNYNFKGGRTTPAVQGPQKGVGSSLRKAGISGTPHFWRQLAKRARQGRVTEEATLRALRRGRLFWDKKNQSYIHYDSQTGVYVATSQIRGGTARSVMQGNVSRSWNPIVFRP